MCWEHIITSYKIKLSVNKNIGASSTTEMEEFFVSFFTVKKEKKSE